jgi:hypothetical protein
MSKPKTIRELALEVVEKSPQGIGTNTIADLVQGHVSTVRACLRELQQKGQISSAGIPRGSMQIWFPVREEDRLQAAPPSDEPQPSIAGPFRPSKVGAWLGTTWSNVIARPAGEDHKAYGSLQADGTIKPYHAPVHGCVGDLKDKTGNGR